MTRRHQLPVRRVFGRVLATHVAPASAQAIDPGPRESRRGRRGSSGTTSACWTSRAKAGPTRRPPSTACPAKAEGDVRPPVWNLSRQSAGLCVRFVTDATGRPRPLDLDLGQPGHAAHAGDRRQRPRPLRRSAATGKWQWLGVGRPTEARPTPPRWPAACPPASASTCSTCRSTTASSSVEIGIAEGQRRSTKAPPRPGEHAEADRLLRHVDHAGRLRLAAGHGPHRHPRPPARPPGDQPRLLRQRQDGAGDGRAARRARRRPSTCSTACRTCTPRRWRAHRAVRPRAAQGAAADADRAGRGPHLRQRRARCRRCAAAQRRQPGRPAEGVSTS